MRSSRSTVLPRRRDGDEAAVEALRREEDELLGEALGRKYVEKYFPPTAKARIQELVKNLLLAMGDTIQGLDWMGPRNQDARARKARHLPSEDRLSGQVEGLQRGPDIARRLLEQRRRGHANVGVQTTLADRQADRSRPLGHDAADLRRVLQPALERDRVPRRHPAAARVQHATTWTRSTTARSAWSSATRSATGSTIRARSSTRRDG